MKRKCLLCLSVLFLIGFPGIVFSQPNNIEISTTLLCNGEPFLAVNPANTQNLVVAWMSMRVTGLLSLTITISTRASFDGGTTWGAVVDLPHNGTKWQSADVSMAWRNDGVLFLSYIDYLDSSNTDGGVFIAHSSDGGRSFSTPVKAIDAAEDTDVSLDRPWIAVDNSASATSGNLYVCTKPAPWNPIPNHAYFTRSIDGGVTWSPEMVLDTIPFSSLLVQQPMGSPTVANDGTLYVAYPCLGANNGFALATSHDGGASFARSFILQPTVDLKEKDSIKGGFRLLADPQNSKHLLFVWPDARLGDLDIFSVTSFDGGGTWSTPLRVNDDATGNGVVQDMLWPSFGADGALAIVWRDRRNGADAGYASASDSYFATSSDGGRTWSKNIRMTSVTAPYNKILADPGNDFQSAAIAGDTLYSAWADMRTDSLRIYSTKVALSAPSKVAISVIASEPSLTVAPNPSSDRTSVSFAILSETKCLLRIYDDRGALVRTILDQELSPGLHTIDCSTAAFASGDYLLELFTPAGSARAKLVIRR